MSSEAIVTIAAAVVALTQLCKWSGLPSRRAPFIVLANSALGVLVWIYAHGDPERSRAFEYFAGWIAVSCAAAGVFGFTRESADSLTRMRPRARK